MRPTGDKSIDSAAARADAVILPLPVSRDGVRLNSSPLTLNELSDTLERGQTVFAGMMDGALKSSFFKKVSACLTILSARNSPSTTPCRRRRAL